MAERRYDAFVIRLWQDAATARWVRVDVEHVQADERVVRSWPADAPDAAHQDAGEWVLERLRATGQLAQPPAHQSADLREVRTITAEEKST